MKRLLIPLYLFLVIFLTSCGITEYYYLEPPLENTPATGADPLTNYFNFTIPNIDTGGILQGYVVYYKLYNSSTAANSDISSIDSSNAQYSSKGMERVKSLGYQQMYFSVVGFSDKISVGSGYEQIHIRLVADGSNLVGLYRDTSREYQVPTRGATGYSFEIYENSTNYTQNFQNYDNDKNVTSDDFVDAWYVNAYAAAYGQTSQLASVYSEVLHLGTIVIKKP